MEIKFEGLDEILNKTPTRLLSEPLKRFWERTTLTVVRFARLRAPFRVGRLQDSITNRVDESPIPLWGEVATGVTHRGVSYPTVLQMSDRTHYRATSRMGQPTKGWFTAARDEDATADITRALDTLGSEIEESWLQ